MTDTSFPADLANKVCNELQRQNLPCPDLPVLIDLFQLMYFVSLKTEESEPIKFHLVYINPDNPDPNPPKRLVKNRWNYTRLAEFIPADIPNFVKIANATDPRTSSLGVYPDSKGDLYISGLIDQGNSYYNFVNYEGDSGTDRPGIFQASIEGAGQIVTYIGYEKIAELKVNRLFYNAIDVLNEGPVREALSPSIDSNFSAIKDSLNFLNDDLKGWRDSLASYFLSNLCRLLLRVQNYRHGGAILITPDSSFEWLNVKYGIDYERFRSALITYGRTKVLVNEIENDVSYFLDNGADQMPAELYNSEASLNIDLKENRIELDGVLWFVSLLTRVDGLVLIDREFKIKGFGVEITQSQEPKSVLIANDSTGSKTDKGIYNHFGTRHRSMMRYCSNVPGSIGFVISQDGDVRVMTAVDGKVLIWDNIKLQYSRPKRA